MSEIKYVRGDATGLCPPRQGRALKGRGELRDRPRTTRSDSLPVEPTTRDRFAVTVHDHGEGGS
ncbi:hypothetical protein [Streptomyces sp. NPDC059861]|uniref:hypothetical protein n=1 Tax=Streptomyces sp. NPDC059861 TaxID=3346974 RepID=UPI00364F2AC7